MMYNSVAEFAVKEAELHERLLKIGLMHNTSIMSVGDKPNLKSRMKFLAFMPKNSEQGMVGSAKLHGQAKIKGSKKESTERVKSAAKMSGRKKGKKKTNRSAESQRQPKDPTSANQCKNLSEEKSKNDTIRTKTSGIGNYVTAELKERRKKYETQRGKNSSSSETDKLNSGETRRESTKSEYYASSVEQGQISNMSADISWRNSENETVTMMSQEFSKCFKAGALKKSSEILLLKEMETATNANITGKLGQSTLEEVKEVLPHKSLIQMRTGRKDKKVKRKNKAHLHLKQRMSSEDSDVHSVGMVEVIRSDEKCEDNTGIPPAPRENLSNELSYEEIFPVQDDSDGLRFIESLLRLSDMKKLKENLSAPIHDCSSSPTLNVFHGNRQLLRATRECFYIYRKLEHTGLRVPLQTLHRALLTPTEMRVFNEIRKSYEVPMKALDSTTT